jgi:hypothetical protein
MANKPEPRVDVDLLVRVWGMGTDGRPFLQKAHASNISEHGAKLSGIEHPLAAGDIVGVQLGEKKARFKVMWVIDAGLLQNIQAGVQILDGQQCPWEDEMARTEEATASVQDSPSAQNQRKFPRHKIAFPIEISAGRDSKSLMRTQATDINGRGCYVETMLPLPVGKELTITFWMESDKVTTPAIVRACDGGVGMGIEFTGLDDQKQQRLQSLLETMDPETTAKDSKEGV